jgi:hypothetical protein
VSQPRDLDIHQVAVVVFIQARGVDERDAGNGAMMAVRQAWGPGTLLPVRSARGTENVRVVDAMEVGMAAGNGYLWTEVTGKAFRQYEEDEDPGQYI